MAGLAGRRVVVTGGAGFIGSHVVDRLVALGAEVIVVDDLSVGNADNVAGAVASGRARLVRADVRDLGAMCEALAGAHAVLHLAVQCLRVSLADPALVHEVNATGTLNLLRAAVEAKVARFVYCSSSEVYGSAVDAHAPMDESHPLLPTTPYGASKAAGELYTDSFQRSYGLQTTVVRPFNTFGPRSHAQGPYGEVIPRFVARVRAGLQPVIFGDGEQTRDFTYVEDTAQGLVTAATSEATIGQTINVARGREVSMNELALAVARVLGRPELRPIHEAPRPADVRRHSADVTRAERLMGFRATIDLDEGLRRYVAWSAARAPEVSGEDAGRRNWL
jgi:UDP-glucose 4-epimerase